MEKSRRKIRKGGICGNATKCIVTRKRKEAEKSRERKNGMHG